MTVQLPLSDVETLRTLAAARGGSVTELLRRIIRTEALLGKEAQRGHTLLIGDAHGVPIRELVRL